MITKKTIRLLAAVMIIIPIHSFATEDNNIEGRCCVLESQGEALQEKGQSLRKSGMKIMEDGKRLKNCAYRYYYDYLTFLQSYKDEITAHKVEMEKIKQEGLNLQREGDHGRISLTDHEPLRYYNEDLVYDGNKKIRKWNDFCEQWKDKVNEIVCCIKKKEDLTKQGNNLLRLGADQMREGMNCYFAGCDLIRDAEIIRLCPETQEEFETMRKQFRKRDTGVEDFNW